MDNKVSLVVITRNEPSNVIDIVVKMHEFVDDIVIVDSSSKEIHYDLKASLQQFSGTLRLFRAASLGYADPLRSFAYSKAKHENIFYLDSDERPNETLRESVRSLFQLNNNASAMSVNRLTHGVELKLDRYAPSRASSSIPTRTGDTTRIRVPAFRRDFQIRLFKKSRIADSGIAHDPPKIHGKVFRLPTDYLIYEERSDLDTIAKLRRDMLLEMVMRRFSYNYIIDKWPNHFLQRMLHLYLLIMKRRSSDELRPLEYVIAGNLERFWRERDLSSMLFSDVYSNVKSKTIRNLPNVISEMLRQISYKIWHSGGITKLLDLCDESAVNSLTEKQDNLSIYGAHFLVFVLLSTLDNRGTLKLGNFSFDQFIVNIEEAIDEAIATEMR